MKLFGRIDNPDPEWLKNSSYTFYLPTEVVIHEPKVVVPNQGRYYDLDYYVRNGQIISYEELSKLPDFKGTMNEIPVFLYEVWANYGYDGHTSYKLICWMFHPEESKHPWTLYDQFYNQWQSGKIDTVFENGIVKHK